MTHVTEDEQAKKGEQPKHATDSVGTFMPSKKDLPHAHIPQESFISGKNIAESQIFL